MSKKIVRLSESDLHNIIKESVQSILNEISYSTASSAYNKMYDNGQKRRAMNLSDTFSSIYNDDVAEYDLNNDELTLYGDEFLNGNQVRQFKNVYNRNGDTNLYLRSKQNGDSRYGSGYDDNKYFNRGNHITTNPKKAREMEKHMKNYNPDSELTKNDFRY